MTRNFNHWLQKLKALTLLVAVAPIQTQSLQCSSCPLRLSSGFQFTTPKQRAAWSGIVPAKYDTLCIRQIRNKRYHWYTSPLFSSKSNDVDIDEDFDDFMDELLKESAAASANEIKSEMEKKGKQNSSHFIQGETAIGIGGNDGFVYDVNALKRNLVQESVRGCKQELLALLGDGRQDEVGAKDSARDGKQNVVAPRWRRERDDLIEERLSALVQANPVSTTTDSNLLDGEWSFAFATNSASTILDTSRVLLSKTKRPDDIDGDNAATAARGGPWRFRAGKTDNPFRSSTREIYLENLSGDENAHLIDETRVLGGTFQISRRYDVFGLTRTAIDLDLMESESRLFGFRISCNDREDFEGTVQGQPLEIQVLYLDTDLCICTTGAGLDGPLHVYTKSDLWVTGRAKRKLRLIAKTVYWISTMQSPLRLRQRLSNAFNKKNDDPMKTRPGLKAVNIGELDINKDGTTREDTAWDGPDDPFQHLSPGERMEVLRTMSLQDIYQSALERKEQNKKQKKKWGVKRSNKFKRPDA